ncbi:ferric reductase family protein [Aspergillus clavatus NRRL 1]|uniref:ferric-chelate reductase (NADPH) n=1 Tax=Aspergillus clavatus (strain ATCC 1007 / CBS 513.65 / DSM 816 / NCTC 3887 / NRRL 1 / QM 1276 / 107) TaxID=344612 RepID=A1C979_ASPCL|nr:ferric-chelate reductase, putative [Aspergillus clavatus NRRL 1]EAW13403.1 ferric-chelate reductase, putative [Aspergillus clavatus NRRL 1]
MDMSESSGLPWLDQPVLLHSSRKDTCKLNAEECAYRRGYWRYWYEADHVYALNTVYFMCAIIGVFTTVHYTSQYAPPWIKRTAIWRRVAAVLRYLSYKGYQMSALHYRSPSLGVILLGLVGVVFFFAMTLGPRPYYWPNTATVSYGNSPPIATRTGWMALALLPFVLALGSKANLVSMLTGVSHEKLQIFHHWASYAMFVLALIHTFPFIIFHINKGDMVKQWKTNVTYWTGVAALIPQAYLTVMSLPAIRNRYYEFFKATHVLIALLFILFFFFHCDFRLSSWDYFIAGGCLYTFSLCIGYTRTFLINGLHTSTLDLLPCGLLRVKIPTITTWHPGQHISLRFLDLPSLGLHCLTAHPFTIASVAHDPDHAGKATELIFYIRPRHGITGRLARLAAKSPGAARAVLLEGPYGGVTTPLSHFTTLLVLAGGSGAGFSLAVLADALKTATEKTTVQIVFATRSPAVAEWYVEEVESRVSALGTADVAVSIYVTASGPETARGVEDGKETRLSGEHVTSSALGWMRQGRRPDLPAIIASSCAARPAARVGIFACGPASMLHDARNAAAQAQRAVVRNGVEEVYLHMEPFS